MQNVSSRRYAAALHHAWNMGLNVLAVDQSQIGWFALVEKGGRIASASRHKGCVDALVAAIAEAAQLHIIPTSAVLAKADA